MAITYIRGPIESMFLNGPTLKGSGDSNSTQRLILWEGYSSIVNCVDVQIRAKYTLENQSQAHNEKLFRFIGIPSSKGDFTWSRGNEGYAIEAYCGVYLKVALPNR